MDNNEQEGGFSEPSSQSSSSYAANKIGRREALIKMGVIVGGITFVGLGAFVVAPKAQGALEQQDDPTSQGELHSGTVYGSIMSPVCCVECNNGSGCSIMNYVPVVSSWTSYWWS